MSFLAPDWLKDTETVRSSLLLLLSIYSAVGSLHRLQYFLCSVGTISLVIDINFTVAITLVIRSIHLLDRAQPVDLNHPSSEDSDSNGEGSEDGDGHQQYSCTG